MPELDPTPWTPIHWEIISAVYGRGRMAIGFSEDGHRARVIAGPGVRLVNPENHMADTSYEGWRVADYSVEECPVLVDQRRPDTLRVVDLDEVATIVDDETPDHTEWLADIVERHLLVARRSMQHRAETGAPDQDGPAADVEAMLDELDEILGARPRLGERDARLVHGHLRAQWEARPGAAAPTHAGTSR